MKELWKNLKFAWIYAKDQKYKLIKYILASVIAIVISIISPLLSTRAIVLLTDNALYQLILIAIVIFLVENTRNIIRYFANIYSQIIYRESFTKIQTSLGKEILKLENKVLEEKGSGVFIQRLTGDTRKLADIFNVLNDNLSNIVTDLGIFVAVLIIDKIAFFYLVVAVLILYFVEKRRTDIYYKEDKEYRKKEEKVTGFVGEMVRGARDIKMLDAEDSFTYELNQKIVNLNENKYNIHKTNRRYRLLSDFTRDLADLLLIILLVYLIMNQNLPSASAIIIYYYSGRLFNMVYHVGMLLDNVVDFNLSASRIFEIMKGSTFKKEKFGKTHLDKVKGDFEFKNVTFSYDKETVLNDISFKIHANETVAFVGKSGAGKSTIFSLLCKMYDIEHGKITIDDIDIKELDRQSIRGNITIISQDPYIFNLSIRDNLRLVKKDLTDEEMIEACKMSCLDDFIASLPDGYNTIIGEGGVNLSGGQKQRLAIARAFVQKTEIILFDEATSALDNETQASIQKAIDNMKDEYTILIIAHRLSTIINSDRILFLDDGKIEMEGTHEELLKKSNKYKQLYEAEIKNDNLQDEK